MRLAGLALAIAAAAVPLAAAGDTTAEPGSEQYKTIKEYDNHDHHVGWDLAATGRQAGLGFVGQFTELDSWILIIGLADVTFLLSLNEVAVQQSIEDAHVLGGAGEAIGDVTGLVLNFGLAPIGAYAIGRLLDDERAIHFGIELAATQLIVSIETILISQIPFHERPAVEKGDRPREEQDFLDDMLRGRSSYPSGHMIGISTLMFKGWEHYGWPVGAPATIATIFVGWARVQAGDHYLTDVFGTLGLAGIASLAVTRARDLWPHAQIGNVRTADLFVLPLADTSHGTVTVCGQF